MHLVLIRRGYSSTGGAEAYLLRLTRALLAGGHRVTLVADRSWPAEVLPDGLELEVLEGGSPRRFANAVRDWREAAPGAPRVLSLERLWNADWYRAGDGVHAAWLERRKGFESRWRTLGRVFNDKHSQILALEESLASDPASRILCNSELVVQEWVRHYGVLAERLAVVRNGFDADPRWLGADRGALRDELAGELGLAPDRPWVLFTGSGFERKGLDLLLAALRRSKRQLELLVAGRGRRVSRLPAGVHLLGPRRDVPRLACAADLFCLPTWYDPFSNATLEATAYGCPVITTTANGFHEVMDAPEHGSVVEAGDVESLAAALDHWSEPGRAAAARQACCDNAAVYSVARNVEATVRLLKSAAG